VVNFTDSSLSIGGVDYTLTTCLPLNLVPPASTNGVTTVQGQIAGPPS
jgi:hypothetical protein